jgi:hypothetical protein
VGSHNRKRSGKEQCASKKSQPAMIKQQFWRNISEEKNFRESMEGKQTCVTWAKQKNCPQSLTTFDVPCDSRQTKKKKLLSVAV